MEPPLPLTLGRSLYTRANPSPAYLDNLARCQGIHERTRAFTGRRSFAVYQLLRGLVRRHGSTTLLDYGSGRGGMWTARDTIAAGHLGDVLVKDAAADLGVAVTCYDPAWPPYAQLPVGTFDAVLCMDVLGSIPAADIPWVLAEIFGYAHHFVLFSLSCIHGKKARRFGDAACIRPPAWWLEQFALYCRPGLSWLARLRYSTAEGQRGWGLWLGGYGHAEPVDGKELCLAAGGTA